MEVSADQLERFLRWTKYILGIAGTVGGWAMALTIWLVVMRGEVTQLRIDTNIQAINLRDFKESVLNLNTPLSTRVINIEKRIDALDTNGSRAVETLRNRQVDVIATNNAQEARIRQLENAQTELLAKALENKYQIDQIFQIIRTYVRPQVQPQHGEGSTLHENAQLFQMPP